MENKHYEESLKENLTISEVISSINELEDNQGLSKSKNLIKWKTYCHQVVVESDNYFYKVYEQRAKSDGAYLSIVRSCLAQVYRDLGIDWSIISFERDGIIFDFEQREKLKVATQEDGPFENILLSFSYILDKVEEMLQFDSILEQIKTRDDFSSVVKLKLTRNCVNKYDDYAIFEGRSILLDDADFYIALLDEKGIPVHVCPEIERKVITKFGDFMFTGYKSYNFKEDKILKELPIDNDVTHAFYMLRLPAGESQTSMSCASDPSQEKAIMKKDFIVDEYTLCDSYSADIAQRIKISEEALFESSLNFRMPYYQQKEVSNLSFKTKNKINCFACDKNNKRPLVKYLLRTGVYEASPFSGKSNAYTLSSKTQLEALSDLQDDLNQFDNEKYDKIYFWGLDFFENQLASEEVKKAYFKMLNTLRELQNEKKLISIVMSVMLANEHEANLYKTFEAFENLAIESACENNETSFWLLTQWAPQSKEENRNLRSNWEFHMQNITNSYPWVKRMTCISMTEDLCQSYLNGTFQPKLFVGKFNTSILFRFPHLKGDTTCLPKRKTFRNFLLKYKKQEPKAFLNLLDVNRLNDVSYLELAYPSIMHNLNFKSNQTVIEKANAELNFEHSNFNSVEKFIRYADSNVSPISDWKQIYEALKTN